MKTEVFKLSSALVVSAFLAVSAQAGNNPVDEDWWPSEFGPDDEAGATNYITPEKRMAAAQLVKTGRVATLGMPLAVGLREKLARIALRGHRGGRCRADQRFDTSSGDGAEGESFTRERVRRRGLGATPRGRSGSGGS